MFPKCLYHKDAKLHEKGHVLDISDDVKGQITVNSQEEQDALADYIEGPDFYAPKADPKPAAKAKGKKSEE